jgi:hypothetical protein
MAADVASFSGAQAPPFRASRAAALGLQLPKEPAPAHIPKIVRVERKHTLRGHADPVTSLCFSPDSFLLASGSDDNTVRMWDVLSGNLRTIFTGHVAKVGRGAAQRLRLAIDGGLRGLTVLGASVLAALRMAASQRVPPVLRHLTAHRPPFQHAHLHQCMCTGARAQLHRVRNYPVQCLQRQVRCGS